MSIPKHRELYSNVLSLFSNETEEYKTRYVKRIVADLLNLPPEERTMLKEGTNEPLIEYRLGWTLTYLKKAGLLESKRRGYVNITKEGLKEIKENPNITEKDLYKFPSFVEFKRRKKDSNDENSKLNFPDDYLDSLNQMSIIFNKHNSLIANKLLKILSGCDIIVFEKLLHDLILKMNFGEIKLKTNDSNEIEGFFNKDAFGIDKIAVHAVNKSDEIKISDLQQFAGFIVSKGFTKGIFITSSTFNKNVIDYVENLVNLNIILIDGKRLSKLLVKNDIGTFNVKTYKIKEINLSYFDNN